MPAPWIIIKEKPVVEKAVVVSAPEPTIPAPKKARKKTVSTTTKSSEK
jgi:hypothetical protein